MTVKDGTASAAAREDMMAWAEATWQWVQAHSLDIAIAAAAGLLIYTVLRFIRRRVRVASQRQVDRSSATAIALAVLARTGHFFLIMVSVRLVAGYASPPDLLAQTIRFLFIVAVAFQAAVWAKAFVMALVRERAQVSGSDALNSALSLINVLVTVAVFIIAGIVILDNLGVNVTGLVAGLGIGGIAIGLAAKGIFEDLFAALAIIFDRPFRAGEAIRFDNTNATVERIGLKSTRLRAMTGEEVIISNTNLLSKEIANLARQSRRRISLPFGLTYEAGADKLARVPDIARAVVERHGAELVRCGFISYGASSVDFDLQFDVMTQDYDVVFAARHAIGLDLMADLAAAGMGFAYPTQLSYTADPQGRLILPYAEDGGHTPRG